MKTILLTLTLIGSVAAASIPASAQAHGPGGRYGYRVPGYSYYGNGGHDLYPHWHSTTTPFGSFQWYGTGAHDYRPHWHSVSPYGYQGYSRTPFGWTRSYYANPYFSYGW